MADFRSEIRAIGDAYSARVDDIHDDCVHTRILWNNLYVRIKHYGENPIVQNPVTGRVASGAELANKVLPSLFRLNSRSFKDVVAQFELFVAALLRLWLAEKPALLSEKAIDVATLLACRTLADARTAAVHEAAESTIAGLMFGRPERWFNYLRKNLSVRISAVDETAFVEMKARRDVLEHNNGIVESMYLEKAKAAAKFSSGDRIEVVESDVDEAYDVVQRLIRLATMDANSAA